MGIRFVTPETVRLPLNDGDDYIVIKRRLSHGEREEMMAGLVPNLTAGQPVHVDAAAVRTGKVLAYLIGWSSPEPIDVDTIKHLDPDSFDEIERAIDAHVATSEKKVLTTALGSVPTFASVAP
jgi:hypothetical protein